MKRNNIEISVKGLILAVVVIIAVILSSIALYMVTRGKDTVNDGNTQYSQLMSDYSEISSTIYDGLYVSGEKVLDVLDEFCDASYDGVTTVTVVTILDTDGETYTKDSAYVAPTKSDNTYINPSATFVGKITKNDNGMVTDIKFTQTK